MSTEPIEIEKLEVSSRLKNCMRRSGISDLRDIVRRPKESIFRIRNMGDATYKELQEQCDKYGIVIRSEKDVIAEELNGAGNNVADSLKWGLGALKI